MTFDHPPVIHDAVITSLVGSTFLSRGRTYSRKGAVFGVEWNPKSLVLKGNVQGTRSNPYKAKVSFKKGISGLRLDWGHCSCPVQFNCKHVAALLLEISSGPVMEQPPLSAVLSLPTVAPAAKPKPASATEKAARKPARATTPPAPWQEKIRSLLHPETALRNPGFTGGTGRPTLRLGVQLELSESPPGLSPWYQRGRSDPWQSEAAPQLTLTARPVKQNPKGSWVVGQLRWDTFRHSHYGYQLDEFTTDQVRWMQTFDAVFAAADSQMPATHLPLERFDSPLLWELLAQAGKIGVALIAGKSGDAVVIHDPVNVALDLRDHDGGLRLGMAAALRRPQPSAPSGPQGMACSGGTPPPGRAPARQPGTSTWLPPRQRSRPPS